MPGAVVFTRCWTRVFLVVSLVTSSMHEVIEVMEVEQVLGFKRCWVVCFPLVCAPLHLASACVWQIHHRLCGFVIVMRSLVFMA